MMNPDEITMKPSERTSNRSHYLLTLRTLRGTNV